MWSLSASSLNTNTDGFLEWTGVVLIIQNRYVEVDMNRAVLMVYKSRWIGNSWGRYGLDGSRGDRMTALNIWWAIHSKKSAPDRIWTGSLSQRAPYVRCLTHIWGFAGSKLRNTISLQYSLHKLSSTGLHFSPRYSAKCSNMWPPTQKGIWWDHKTSAQQRKGLRSGHTIFLTPPGTIIWLVEIRSGAWEVSMRPLLLWDIGGRLFWSFWSAAWNGLGAGIGASPW